MTEGYADARHLRCRQALPPRARARARADWHCPAAAAAPQAFFIASIVAGGVVLGLLLLGAGLFLLRAIQAWRSGSSW